jgi:hypothetical protein
MSARSYNYFVIKCYVADYGIQSPPYVFSVRELVNEDLTQIAREVMRDFLRNLEHKGKGKTIHPSHLRWLKNDMVTWDAKLRNLTPDQLSAMRSIGTTHAPAPARARGITRARGSDVGWETRYGTSRERRDKFLENLR